MLKGTHHRAPLRPVIKHDTEFALSLYQDWRVAQHLNRVSVPFTPVEARRMVDTLVNKASNSVTATYIAHLEDEPVGLCLLHHGQDKREARIGVIGYSVVPAHWGKGYASSMVGALVERRSLDSGRFKHPCTWATWRLVECLRRPVF